MKARKHLLTHVFISLAALPVAVPPAFALDPPALGAPRLPTAGQGGALAQAGLLPVKSAVSGTLVAQAAEQPKPAPDDENDPERKKKHEEQKKPGEEPGKQSAPPEPKPEQPKPDAAKPEPAKPEPPKPEPPKPEPPKAEPAKPDMQKQEAPKPEPPKAEKPKPEPAKPEPAKPEPEAPKAEAPKPEAPKPAPAQAEPPKSEPAKQAEPKPEPAKPAPPKPDDGKSEAKPAPAPASSPTPEPKTDAKPAPKSEAKPASEPAPEPPKAEKPQADQGTPPAAKTLGATAPVPAAEGQQAPVLDSAKQAPAPDSAKQAPDAAPDAKAQAAPAAPAAAPEPGRDGKRLLRAPVGTQSVAPPPPPPKSDADAQAPIGNAPPPPKLAPTADDRGQRMQGRPRYDAPRDAQVEGRVDGRDILNILGQMIVRGGDSDRFNRDGAQTYYDELPRGRTREVVERPNGVQIVTIRNRYGDVIQRSRIDRRGREVVLFYAPELENRPDREQVFRDPSLDLPPMRLDIPVDQYIIDTSSVRNPDYYDFLREPPVERVERVYSLDEVRYSARIRDKMRRVDLDTIHFTTGSADVSMNEAASLKKIAAAMKRIIDRNPAETFLIEGHTDAVGSDQSNLVLSDRRAESVAVTLSDLFGVPPENLVTQGYGERFLKVRTAGPSAENRRVTIRRITPLVRPVASR